VRVDGAQVEPDYEPERTALRVPLAAPLQPGETATIELDFTVDVAQEMGGNYGTFGYFNDILVLDEFYPVIPAHDQDGWHFHVPTNGDLTYLDASFYLVQVSAPKKLVMVASGIEVSREQSGKEQVVTYAAGPARDFYLAASDKYKVVSRDVGDTRLNSYAFANRKAGAELVLDIAENALRIFNRRFGVYPYTEMDLVSTPMQALGIEYPGVMGITLETYDLDASLYGLPAPAMLESVVAHEVGHQWFYNVVGNNQVGEPWLDEAVVQYATGLYYKDRYGMSGYKGYSDSWYSRWDRVERAEIPIGMPSEAYTPTQYSAIVYGRGPIFVDALAEEMGAAAFDAFIQDYFQSHVWEIGTGEAFKEMAEAHCECDLTPLFEAWVYE
jgi:aminopeptidase N